MNAAGSKASFAYPGGTTATVPTPVSYQASDDQSS